MLITSAQSNSLTRNQSPRNVFCFSLSTRSNPFARPTRNKNVLPFFSGTAWRGISPSHLPSFLLRNLLLICDFLSLYHQPITFLRQKPDQQPLVKALLVLLCLEWLSLLRRRPRQISQVRKEPNTYHRLKCLSFYLHLPLRPKATTGTLPVPCIRSLPLQAQTSLFHHPLHAPAKSFRWSRNQSKWKTLGAHPIRNRHTKLLERKQLPPQRPLRQVRSSLVWRARQGRRWPGRRRTRWSNEDEGRRWMRNSVYLRTWYRHAKTRICISWRSFRYSSTKSSCDASLLKPIIQQASIDYLRYLEQCISNLQAANNSMSNPIAQTHAPPRLNTSFSPESEDNEISDDDDDEDQDQEMANTGSTVTTPAFSALDAQSRAASAYESPQSTHTSPALDPTIPHLTSSSSYASTTVSTLPSPAYGPQHTPLHGPRFGGYTTSATTSPILLPDPKHPDHEATAALLMLNQQDRRNPCSGRGMSVKDLLSSWILSCWLNWALHARTIALGPHYPGQRQPIIASR